MVVGVGGITGAAVGVAVGAGVGGVSGVAVGTGVAVAAGAGVAVGDAVEVGEGVGVASSSQPMIRTPIARISSKDAMIRTKFISLCVCVLARGSRVVTSKHMRGKRGATDRHSPLAPPMSLRRKNHSVAAERMTVYARMTKHACRASGGVPPTRSCPTPCSNQ